MSHAVSRRLCGRGATNTPTGPVSHLSSGTVSVRPHRVMSATSASMAVPELQTHSVNTLHHSMVTVYPQHWQQTSPVTLCTMIPRALQILTYNTGFGGLFSPTDQENFRFFFFALRDVSLTKNPCPFLFFFLNQSLDSETRLASAAGDKSLTFHVCDLSSARCF